MEKSFDEKMQEQIAEEIPKLEKELRELNSGLTEELAKVKARYKKKIDAVLDLVWKAQAKCPHHFPGQGRPCKFCKWPKYDSDFDLKQTKRRYTVGVAGVTVDHAPSGSGGSTPSRRTNSNESNASTHG